MNKWQKDVLDFHKKFGCDISYIPTIVSKKQSKLRLDLIKEETKELKQGMKDGDIVEVADALADLIYVTLGTAVAYGIDLEPIWNEVHKTNMAKVGGNKRKDGKILKPAGWIKPDIESIINKLNIK